MLNNKLVVHPAWLRLTHWTNALAVLVLVLSGWKIYNATAFLGFAFDNRFTLGGWLGGALLWPLRCHVGAGHHGTIYLLINAFSGRLKRQFFPLSPKLFIADVLAALKGKLSHADPRHYNTVQRVAYLFVMLDSLLLVLSGLVLWKSVQFPLLRTLLGGYEGARLVHFCAMAALVAFVAVHLVMVLLVPRTLVAMLRGR